MDILNGLAKAGLTVLGSLGPVGATVANLINVFTDSDTEVNSETPIESLQQIIPKLPPDVQKKVIDLLTASVEGANQTAIATIEQQGMTARVSQEEITKRLELYTANDKWTNARPVAYIACVAAIVIICLGYFTLMVIAMFKQGVTVPSWQDIAVIITPLAVIAERYQKHRETGKVTKASIINGGSGSAGNIIDQAGTVVDVISKASSLLGKRK